MDAARFDAWTRRRFGRAAAGVFAALLGAATYGSSLARKGKRGKKRKQRKKRCERLSTRCNPNNDRRVCCNPYSCQIVAGVGSHRCCKGLHLACTGDAECCGTLRCVGEGDARSCRTEP